MAGSVLLLVSLTICQRLVGLVRGILVCRWLPSDEVGLWELAQSFLLVVPPLIVLGLPGSFARYLGHYRQRGQLRTFLRRTTLVCSGLTLTAVGLIAAFHRQFSWLIFDDWKHGELVLWLAPGVLAVAMYNFTCSLFNALRRERVYTLLQFAFSMLFALFSLVFVLGLRWPAEGVVAAYGLASILPVLVSLPLLRQALSNISRDELVPPQRDFWAKLLPFAFWIWAADFMTNLFAVADRSMIVHFSGLQGEALLAAVGDYHTSRVVPMVLTSVAYMLGTMLAPHLTHDWEIGRKAEVSAKLTLALKLVALSLTGAAVLVILGSPLLFDWLLAGKFPSGHSLLPLTMVYCIWWGLSGVAQTYLWCAEHAWLGTLAFALGLLATVALNLLLLPSYGVHGAVIATAGGNLTALVLICGFAIKLGLRLDGGLVVLAALPVCLYLPIGWAIAAIGTCLAAGWWSSVLFTPQEWNKAKSAFTAWRVRFRRIQR